MSDAKTMVMVMDDADMMMMTGSDINKPILLVTVAKNRRIRAAPIHEPDLSLHQLGHSPPHPYQSSSPLPHTLILPRHRSHPLPLAGDNGAGEYEH